MADENRTQNTRSNGGNKSGRKTKQIQRSQEGELHARFVAKGCLLSCVVFTTTAQHTLIQGHHGTTACKALKGQPNESQPQNKRTNSPDPTTSGEGTAKTTTLLGAVDLTRTQATREWTTIHSRREQTDTDGGAQTETIF